MKIGVPQPLGAVQSLLMEIVTHAAARTSPTQVTDDVDTFPERSSPTAAGLGGYHVPISVPPLGQQTSSIPPHATAPFEGREPVHTLPAGPERIVSVVSPKGGCGKTTVALNLALSLARQARRVVLLDTDVNGDMLSAIDARAGAKFGFSDLLAGEDSVREALLPTVFPASSCCRRSAPHCRIAFRPAQRLPELPGEWLFDTSIPRHRAFLDALHKGVPLRHVNENAPPVAQPQPLLV